MSTPHAGTGWLFATHAEAAPFLHYSASRELPDSAIPIFHTTASDMNGGGWTGIIGMGPQNAAQATHHFLKHFAVTHIINAGVAGALSPKLPVGYLARVSKAAEAAKFSDSEPASPPPWISCRSDFWIDLPLARLLSVTTPVFDDHRKRALARWADLVDMEGATVARICRAYDMPCYVLKCISDGAIDGDRKTLHNNLKGSSERLAEQLMIGAAPQRISCS